jgi:hypothetical protein
MQAGISALFDAVRNGGDLATRELPVIPQGASGRGSTLYVDFYSTKPIYPVEKCHLNAMVADTGKWEQSAAFALDAHPGVARWVKNDHLGFVIPYRKRNIQARYIPDFVVVLDNGLQLIVEVKGQYDDDADVKAKAAERWVQTHAGQDIDPAVEQLFEILTKPYDVQTSLLSRRHGRWSRCRSPRPCISMWPRTRAARRRRSLAIRRPRRATLDCHQER